MKTFGNKEEFAITLDFYTDKYKDDEYLKENIDEFHFGAEVYFWVKGKNLFAFQTNAPNETYGCYNLYALVDFLSDYLAYHISEEPFPTITKATNAIDMIEETALVKSDVEDELEAYETIDWDNVDQHLVRKIGSWISPRTFLGNRGGTFLPNIMVRRVANTVEISWHNRHPHYDGENEIYFLYKKGVEYINSKLYKDVVIQFCLAYIDRIQWRKPEHAKQYRNNLKKVINIKL